MDSQLYLGSCREYLPRVGDNSVDLIITSPPYGTGKEYEDYPDNWECLIKFVVSESDRVVGDTGSICFQIGNKVNGSGKTRDLRPLDLFLWAFMRPFSWKLKNRIVWCFGHGLHNTHSFSGRYETIMWFAKDDYTFNLDSVRVPQKYPNKKHFKGAKKGQLSGNPLGKNPSDVWEITNVKHNHPEKLDHPCQFPEELVRRLVLSLSNEGDTVLDPFMGVGTVGKVCKDLGRKFIGIEKEEKYFIQVQERINNA